MQKYNQSQKRQQLSNKNFQQNINNQNQFISDTSEEIKCQYDYLSLEEYANFVKQAGQIEEIRNLYLAHVQKEKGSCNKRQLFHGQIPLDLNIVYFAHYTSLASGVRVYVCDKSKFDKFKIENEGFKAEMGVMKFANKQISIECCHECCPTPEYRDEKEHYKCDFAKHAKNESIKVNSIQQIKEWMAQPNRLAKRVNNSGDQNQQKLQRGGGQQQVQQPQQQQTIQRGQQQQEEQKQQSVYIQSQSNNSRGQNQQYQEEYEEEFGKPGRIITKQEQEFSIDFKNIGLWKCAKSEDKVGEVMKATIDEDINSLRSLFNKRDIWPKKRIHILQCIQKDQEEEKSMEGLMTRYLNEMQYIDQVELQKLSLEKYQQFVLTKQKTIILCLTEYHQMPVDVKERIQKFFEKDLIQVCIGALKDIDVVKQTHQQQIQLENAKKQFLDSFDFGLEDGLIDLESSRFQQEKIRQQYLSLITSTFEKLTNGKSKPQLTDVTNYCTQLCDLIQADSGKTFDVAGELFSNLFWSVFACREYVEKIHQILDSEQLIVQKEIVNVVPNIQQLFFDCHVKNFDFLSNWIWEYGQNFIPFARNGYDKQQEETDRRIEITKILLEVLDKHETKINCNLDSLKKQISFHCQSFGGYFRYMVGQNIQCQIQPGEINSYIQGKDKLQFLDRNRKQVIMLSIDGSVKIKDEKPFKCDQLIKHYFDIYGVQNFIQSPSLQFVSIQEQQELFQAISPDVFEQIHSVVQNYDYVQFLNKEKKQILLVAANGDILFEGQKFNKLDISNRILQFYGYQSEILSKLKQSNTLPKEFKDKVNPLQKIDVKQARKAILILDEQGKSIMKIYEKGTIALSENGADGSKHEDLDLVKQIFEPEGKTPQEQKRLFESFYYGYIELEYLKNSDLSFMSVDDRQYINSLDTALITFEKNYILFRDIYKKQILNIDKNGKVNYFNQKYLLEQLQLYTGIMQRKQERNPTKKDEYEKETIALSEKGVDELKIKDPCLVKQILKSEDQDPVKQILKSEDQDPVKQISEPKNPVPVKQILKSEDQDPVKQILKLKKPVPVKQTLKLKNPVPVKQTLKLKNPVLMNLLEPKNPVLVNLLEPKNPVLINPVLVNQILEPVGKT